MRRRTCGKSVARKRHYRFTLPTRMRLGDQPYHDEPGELLAYGILCTRGRVQDILAR